MVCSGNLARCARATWRKPVGAHKVHQEANRFTRFTVRDLPTSFTDEAPRRRALEMAPAWTASCGNSSAGHCAGGNSRRELVPAWPGLRCESPDCSQKAQSSVQLQCSSLLSGAVSPARLSQDPTPKADKPAPRSPTKRRTGPTEPPEAALAAREAAALHPSAAL